MKESAFRTGKGNNILNRHKTYIKVLILLCVVVLSGLLSSCNLFEIIETPNGNIQVTPTGGPENSNGPVKGGNLTIASTKDETLNPLKTNNFYMEEVLGLIYDGLVYIDNNMQAVPLLAESLSSTADGITWTIKLKEDIVWHDGTYFSAEDVKHTMQFVMDNPENKYYHCVKNIKTVDVEGGYTLIINCKEPDSFFDEKMYFPIIPKHVEIDNNPVGTGSYKFSSINDENMILNSNTNNITTVTVRFYDTTKAVMYSDCDIVMVKYEDYNKIEGKVGYSIKKYISPEFEVMAVNTQKSILSMSSVRRAIAYGLDKRGAVDKISYSKVVLSDLPVFPETWISPVSKLVYYHNEEEALRLLATTGYKDLKFNCLVNKDDKERKEYAEYFKKELNSIGITIEIIEVSTEDMLGKLQSKDYDLALLGINITRVDDLKSFYGTEKENNITGYSNIELDTLFSKLDRYIYQKERKNIYSEIEDILLVDSPYIGLFYKQNFIFYNNKRVIGIEESKPNYIKKLNNIDKWYIKDDLEGQ